MTASEVGAVPDDVIEAARNAAYGATWGVPMSQIDLAIKAVLSVPALAEVTARDAKVREIVGRFPYGATDSQMVAMAEDVLAAFQGVSPT